MDCASLYTLHKITGTLQGYKIKSEVVFNMNILGIPFLICFHCKIKFQNKVHLKKMYPPVLNCKQFYFR